MLVVWFDQPACLSATLTGGKGANLGRLAATYPVPPGFCLTSEAYARWAGAGCGSSMPPDVEASLGAAYSTLAERSRAAPLRVAVRSSAVGEDSESASFAGQYSSYLNVSGLDAVADAVTRCWASAATDQVQAYQRHQGRVSQPVAVVVQELVAADVAFVAFSAHPVTGSRDEVVINANWGLGESIVNGTVIPDTFVVRKDDLSLVAQTIGDKRRMTVLRPDGVEEVNVPRLMHHQVTLTPAQAIAIARLATELESELNWPVDIEGAYHGDGLFLLQCRPISVRV